MSKKKIMSSLTKKQNNYHTRGQEKRKKKKEKERGNMPTHSQGKKKKNYTWAFLSIKQPHFLHSVFFLFWGKKILVAPRRKHPDPTIYFPSSPPNQTH